MILLVVFVAGVVTGALWSCAVADLCARIAALDADQPD